MMVVSCFSVWVFLRYFSGMRSDCERRCFFSISAPPPGMIAC